MPLTGYPDGIPTARLNQFATVIVGSTSTGGVNYPFNFQAALLKTVIDSGGPAYLQFNGALATTNDYKLSSGDVVTDWYDIGPFSGVSVSAGTSTSLNMRVGAWGG